MSNEASTTKAESTVHSKTAHLDEQSRAAAGVTAAELRSAANAAASVPLPVATSPAPEKFLSRELSWLRFNERVLYQAEDERTPLLERLNFLSIFSSNLDEFIMKRVGGLKRQLVAGVLTRTADGMTPAQQLASIRQMVLPMLHHQGMLYAKQIKPALAGHGVHLLHWDELSDRERKRASEYFMQNVFPVLTPLSVDPGHPFPFLSNLSMSLGVTLRYPDSDERFFARVKVPPSLPRWLLVRGDQRGGEMRFVSLQDVIRHNLDELFPGMVVTEVMPFRITRNADMERDEEDAEDLLEMVAQEVRQRRFEKVVRLEHGPNPDPWMLRFLCQALELDPQDVYEVPAELDFTGVKTICDLDLPHLKYPPYTATVPPALMDQDADMFAVIREGDLLVHHPYESFRSSVERFVATAADDPKVLAIKMTLYRTGDASPFIPSLIRAAEAGKQVVCLVELKARFDEQRNVQLARALENAGVHVVYGIIGFKTHTKATLVVRQESTGLRCYAHIGTGNYHPGTARLYTDLGLFTDAPDLTDELVEMFHYLTGRSMKRDYSKLLVAPVNMKQRFIAMIAREIEHHLAGKPAHIVAKMNSLEERDVCQALYEASAAGVKIDLIVRGFCCLRAGVPGLSENIRVISIIGRFLEHSRIFYFRNATESPVDGEFYIGSADWMHRNLHARIELATPIERPPHKERLWENLQIMLEDRRQSWLMQPDGTYVLMQPQTPEQEEGTHDRLMRLTRQRASIG